MKTNRSDSGAAADSKPPTHRIYLRWPGQKVTDRTSTECAEVAAYAFARLKDRSDLNGQPVAIAWTLDGQQQAYHDFAQPLSSIATARSRLRPKPASGPAE